MLMLCIYDEVGVEEEEVSSSSHPIDEKTQRIKLDFQDFKHLYQKLYWNLVQILSIHLVSKFS